MFIQELGLESKYVPEKYAHGIYVLGDDAVPGTPALEYLGLDDYVIELGLTPNRMDLLSMKGVAKDVKAMYRTEELPIECNLHEVNEKTSDEISVGLLLQIAILITQELSKMLELKNHLILLKQD